jgi:hypothetical protein
LIDVIDASKKVEFSKASLSIPTQTSTNTSRVYSNPQDLPSQLSTPRHPPCPPQGVAYAPEPSSKIEGNPQWLWQWLWTPGGGGKQQPAAAASPHQSNTPLIQTNTPLIKFNTPLIKSLFSGFGSGFGFFGGWGGAAGGGGY